MFRSSLSVARIVFLLAACAAASAQPATDGALPFDPAVRQGLLDNGLRYFIRANTEPEGRAELRLAVNAGSVLEADDQRGLAHVVEHMAFNGTERFAEPELVRYLESVGTRFGPDLNAYTSFDETVYQLQVPTDSADILETGIDVLREWAGRVTFADSAIERERGVVLEEWRRGQGADERMRRVQLPVLYAGSRYAERLPIGLPEVIREAPPEAIRRFYRDWYRPDLMAVTVVGDIDPDAVEAQIRAAFGSLTMPADAPERASFTVPARDGTGFAVATDPEATQTVVQVLSLRPAAPVRTVADVRAELVEGLFYAALGGRLDEIRRQPDASFAFAFAGSGASLRTLDQSYLIAFAREDQIAEALGVLEAEAERARRFGITESEIARGKAEILRGRQSAVAERDNQPSRALAQALVQSFLRDEPVLSPEARLALAEQLLPGITREEVNAVAETLLSDDDRVVLVTAPAREDLPVPTEAELAAVLAATADAELTPYEDAVDDGPLVPTPPTPGAVVAETTDEALGTTTWTLANGATVVLKPTAFKADEVLLSATSPGGLSLLADDELTVAGGAAGYVGQSGVGAFDATALGKKLTGQLVQVRPQISDRTEGFSGRAAPDDLETLFQLVHLYTVAPRKDAEAFQVSVNTARTFLANQVVAPQTAFRDTLQITLADGHPRTLTLAEYVASLDGADLDRAFAFYQDRFADISDFTFVLVGAFDVEAVRPLVETYLGSLPGGGREETARDIVITPPDGVVEKTVRAGVEPQAQVAIVFHGAMDADDPDARARFAATTDVLSKMLREDLREDRGGVYGVGVQPSVTREPTGRYEVRISFSADPDRVEELVGAVFDEVEALRAGEILPEHLAAYQEQQRRAQETNIQENGYWLGVLTRAALRDEAPAEALSAADRAAAVTVDEVAATAREVLDVGRTVRVTLLPVEDAE